MNNKLSKKSILGNSPVVPKPLDGGTLSHVKENDYSSTSIKKTLEEKGLQASETIEVVNPVTGNKAMVTIERDGTPESKMILALADKKLTRDQKDHTLSMYLWERGKQNSSFFVDLIRNKGKLTTELRAFSGQMRFDFEAFVTHFSHYLYKQADMIFSSINHTDPIKFSGISELYQKYIEFIEQSKKDKIDRVTPFRDFCKKEGIKLSTEQSTLLESAILSYDESDALTATTRKITENRMKEKGFGIYIDRKGKAFSLLEDSEDEILNQVRKDFKELEDNNNSNE